MADSVVDTINLFNKKERVTTTVGVERLFDSKFRMLENDVINHDLTYGTEFDARLNQDGNYEVIKITKKSDFVTRRFILTNQFKESEYGLLGDEIIRQGGYWQVDFGIVTVNLPKHSDLDLNEIFSTFDFRPTELKK